MKRSYCDILGNSKRNLMKIGKKMLNAALECHMAGPHALSHDVSAYIYCGDRPRIIGWLGPGPVQGPVCPRRRRGLESLSRPTGVKRTRPRSHSSSDVPKSGSKVHPSYCNLPSKHVKRKETQNILAKAATTTLNAPQLLSWPY